MTWHDPAFREAAWGIVVGNELAFDLLRASWRRDAIECSNKTRDFLAYALSVEALPPLPAPSMRVPRRVRA